MLLLAAASRRLVNAVLSILIEWPPCHSSTSNGPDVALAGVLPSPLAESLSQEQIKKLIQKVADNNIENDLRPVDGAHPLAL